MRLFFIALLLFCFGLTKGQIPILENSHKLYAELQADDTADLKGLYGFELNNSLDLESPFNFLNKSQSEPNFISVDLALNTFSGVGLSQYSGGLIINGNINRFRFYLAPDFGFAEYNINVSEKTGHHFYSGTPSVYGDVSANLNPVQRIPLALQYEANKHFNLTIGSGKQFIGEGKHSILLSDFSGNHLFGAITTKVWKLKYQNLYSAYGNLPYASSVTNIQKSGSIGNYVNRNNGFEIDRFTTTHYLNIELADWIDLGMFETVVWKSKDTLLNRGFDINYANPVIFYRPVEFSTGSSDNVLMGLNLVVKPLNKMKVYGQFLIDEFLLKYVRADFQHFLNPNQVGKNPWGWWGNKHAGQLGVKWFEPAGIDGFITRLEYNYARPYTYTHNQTTESYSNGYEALAHPLGANFKQFLWDVHYFKNNWQLDAGFVTIKKGFDQNFNNGAATPGNYGGDILLPYGTREQEFFNETGQGYSIRYNQVNLRLSYLLNPRINTKGFLYIASDNRNDTQILVGISTHLNNPYYDL